MFKKLIIYLLVLVMVGSAFGALKPNGAYKGDNSSGFSFTFAGTSVQRDAVPSGVWTKADGDFWYDTTGNQWYTYDSAAWNAFSAGGGTTLTGAYNYGGVGVGRTITAIDGAVNIVSTEADTAFLLTLSAVPGSSAALGGVEITTGTNSTQAAIEVENTGSGPDFEGTGNLFSVSKAGAVVVKGGLIINTGSELLVTARDVLFDDTYDVAWDTSRDMLIWQDNAILGFGGAHDAVADITFKHNGTNLLVEAATQDNTPMHFGSTNAFDIVFYDNAGTGTATLNSGEATLNFNAYDILMQDGDVIAYGDSDDFTMTATNQVFTFQTLTTDETSAWNFGANSDGSDVKLFGAASGAFVLWDASENDFVFDGASSLEIGQAAVVQFIDDTDGNVDWTLSLVTDEILTFIPSETDDTSSYNIGDATNTSDFRLFGATASTIVYDASADLVTYVNYDVLYDDATVFYFGTGKDFSMYSDTADKLEIDPGAAGDQFYLGTSDTDAMDVTWFSDRPGAILFLDEEAASVNFGVDATGLDAVFYGDTTLLNMKWDQANDLLTFTGGTAMLEFRGAVVDVHEMTIAVIEPTASNVLTLADDTGALGYLPIAATTKDATDAAIPLTHAVVQGTSDATSSWSLPDGNPGQILCVVIVTDGGDATITPDSLTGSGWASLILADDGDGVTFMFVDATVGWIILGTWCDGTDPVAVTPSS